MIILKILKTDFTEKYYSTHGTFHEGDIGIDLFIPETIYIPWKETVVLDLNMKCEIIDTTTKKNLAFMVVPRSSITTAGIRQSNSIGIIDAGYRGNLKAPVDNISPTDKYVHEGDRYFQIVLFTGLPIDKIELVDTLSSTTRGTNGFGSTGK